MASPQECKNLCNFTPVRRRDSTINTRRSQSDQEQEWTAARCHRLLRALTSRVAILRKDLRRISSASQNKKIEDSETSRGQKRPANTEFDSDWVQARKRIRQTYSKRRTRIESAPPGIGRKAGGPLLKKERKSMLPGEIAVPTPVLTRAIGLPLAAEAPLKILDSETLERPVRRTKRSRVGVLSNAGDSDFQLSESLPEMRKRITATRYSTYEGIYSGLEALLRATTASGTQPSSKGARSLLSMSLRAVPCYITQQEALLQAYIEKTSSKSAIENRDISAEIYNELETFGTSGNGWKRLKTIVRSHGIRVIRDAIQAGFLDVEFAGALIALCVETSAIDEAQSLLSALLSFAPCPSPQTPYDTPSRPLVMLARFAEHTGRYSFQYRQLSMMVSNYIMPVEWLATKEFGPVWTRIAHSLAPNLEHVESMRFLDLALTMLSEAALLVNPKSCDAIISAVKSTFSSVLTLLSSVVILSQGVEFSSTTKEYGHVSSLLLGCLAGTNPSSTALSDANPLLLMANALVNSTGGHSVGFYDSLLRCLLRRLRRQDHDSAAPSQLYLSIVDFICLVARCCGRGTSTSGFEHLRHLHLLIESAVADIDGGSVFEDLIVDSAFAFAQKLPDRQHVDYATIMDRKFCARTFTFDDKLSSRPTSNSEDSEAGFRWEEGIGEWVTATPTITTTRRTIVEASSSEADTPFRLQPKPRRGNLKESTMGLTSPYTDEDVDLSEDSDAALDELGNCHKSDCYAIHRVFAESDTDSVIDCQNTTLLLSDEFSESIDDAEASMTDAFAASDPLSSIDTPGSLFENRFEPLIREPRLNRELFGNTVDLSSFQDISNLSASSTSTLHDESSDSQVQRDYVARAPRLGRRALRSSQAWQIFDDSDDELSFLSTSSQGDQVLQEITHTTASMNRHLRQTDSPSKQKRSVPTPVSNVYSEDELCI